jgi:NADPH:quinone reductase-like Zn-dependent oxidoreductase
MQAVRFDSYGGVDVLNVVDVPRPVPGPGQVLVQVKAAGINPGEAKIRDGRLAGRFRPRSRPARAVTWPGSWPRPGRG